MSWLHSISLYVMPFLHRKKKKSILTVKKIIESGAVIYPTQQMRSNFFKANLKRKLAGIKSAHRGIVFDFFFL